MKKARITIEHEGPAPADLKLTDLSEPHVFQFCDWVLEETKKAFENPAFRAEFERWRTEQREDINESVERMVTSQ